MRDRLIAALQQALPEHDIPADLADDEDFVVSHGVDSLDLLSLASGLEKAFGIRIADVEWATLRTLADVHRLVSERLASQNITA